MCCGLFRRDRETATPMPSPITQASANCLSILRLQLRTPWREIRIRRLRCELQSAYCFIRTGWLEFTPELFHPNVDQNQESESDWSATPLLSTTLGHRGARCTQTEHDVFGRQSHCHESHVPIATHRHSALLSGQRAGGATASQTKCVHTDRWMDVSYAPLELVFSNKGYCMILGRV